MANNPPINLQATYSINGVTIGQDGESADRIKNACIALHAVVENHKLNDYEIDVALKVVFPQLKSK